MQQTKEVLWAKKVPTNASVAIALGMTNGGISRIRSGDRHPSRPKIQLIEKVYGWSMADQYAAIRGDCYAEEFEKVLNA